MKKTFLTCMAVVALFAIATGASAITCTIDQRPAATLLIPYFQATFKTDGSGDIMDTGLDALDTLVTIGNASAAPMLAHVSVFNDRSELVLDFNVALTGFDIQSWSMAALLHGKLPVTPVNALHQPEVKDNPADTVPGTQVTINGDVCQRNPSAPVYSSPGGYLRVRPANPTQLADNTLATVSYPPPPFQTAFLFQVLDSLDATPDSNLCTGTVDKVLVNPIHGYITIDHANYCNLSNPSDPKYYTQDAIGMENNLWGDYIFTSGAGIGTMGFPAVAIEANGGANMDGLQFISATVGSLADATAAPTDVTSTTPGRRTFYRRYVTLADNGTGVGLPPGCINADWGTAGRATWDCGFGDQREPLGLKYAARWFDSAPNVTSFFNVWRASAVPSLADPLGLGDLLDQQAFPDGCDTSEPTVTLTFYDEDENTVTQGVCPSPCKAPKFNFPLETQRTSITAFTHPVWPAGWVSMEFFNPGGPVGGVLDQAYVTYDLQGKTAFLSAGVPAAQLDPTNCQPLLVPVAPAPGGVTPTAPAIPLIVGTGP